MTQDFGIYLYMGSNYCINMSESQIYQTLERMVTAARDSNRDAVIEINDEFSTLLSKEYRHLPNWSTNKKVVMYDSVRNRACDSVTMWDDRNAILKEMEDRFSIIPKPE